MKYFKCESCEKHCKIATTDIECVVGCADSFEEIKKEQFLKEVE